MFLKINFFSTIIFLLLSSCSIFNSNKHIRPIAISINVTFELL